MNIGLVTIQKNRAPWVHEWLAFHHLVGFSKFYFYAHNCTDHTGPVLGRLSGRYDLKAFMVNTTENQVQLKVYQHAYENFGHECDWLAFIDGDEFLFPTAGQNMAQALEEFNYQKTSAIGAYWACFGSSGHVQEPSGLMVRNYRQRPGYDFEVNRHIKSIVRGRQASRVGPNSHMFVTLWGTQDELGRPVTFGLTPHEPSYTRFRINHYVCQSYQYFKQSKQASGAADAGAAYIRPDSWWTRHDLNHEFDNSLVHLYDALDQEVAQVDTTSVAPVPVPVPA